MSMPSSRLEVATTQGSRPPLSSSSTSVRCSRDIDPWCALATVAAAAAADPGLPDGLGRERVEILGRLDLLGGQLVEPGGEPLGQPPGVGEHDRGAVLPDQLQQPPLDRRPDRRPLRGAGRRPDHLLVGAAGSGPLVERGQVGHRHLDGDLDRLRDRRLDHRPPAGRRPGTWRPRRSGAPWPRARSAGPGASSSSSSRSSDSARCAPRLVPTTACTSSTITVCTPRSDSRAAEVSIRNSDSGVVTSTSGGVRANCRRSSAGVSPVRMPTVMSGTGSPSRRGGLPDAGQRGAQVALHVDGQRLERGHVEHPAAVPGLVRRRAGGQPVQRPEERGQRLAGAGGRDDQRVPARLGGRPGALLRGGGRGEGPA